MFSRTKGMFSSGLWKPKNPHSLEYLKYLYTVLCKNQTVTEQNSSLLVEILRLMTEILIWGDQNDSSVIDFFLEKNILSFFLSYMKQKSSRYICVQLLQTLNILFENIRDKTSIYYLLSNNHINSIICHKFDFSDEEIMAYYISFLKTLSFKLNKHTINFFYNEHTNDFALYTEAIKFFNQSESMVRIAVRTITLNVYRVEDKAMLRYIRDRTAVPYFANLVWFIGSHILEIDSCVRNDADHNSRGRLEELVAEHLDHLHYLNDILCLNIDVLNEVLTDHLVNRLFIPLYVYSLTKKNAFSAATDPRPHVSCVVSLFLLSQVFLIIHHLPLVRQLARIILTGDLSLCSTTSPTDETAPARAVAMSTRRSFGAPQESLAEMLEHTRGRPKPEITIDSMGCILRHEIASSPEDHPSPIEGYEEDQSAPEISGVTSDLAEGGPGSADAVEIGEEAGEVSPAIISNITDEEKLFQQQTQPSPVEATPPQSLPEFTLTKRPFLAAIFHAMDTEENDYDTLFGVCLLYAIATNKGMNTQTLDLSHITSKSENKSRYNVLLVEKLIRIISSACIYGSRVRLITLEMSILLLRELVVTKDRCFLQDRHLAYVEGAREDSTLLLRNYFKSEEIFLDMFEDEYRVMHLKPLNVEYLLMDASLLLTPTVTPLSGIEFARRLPCGDVERARRAIRVFFLLRELSMTLRQEVDDQLPLTKTQDSIKIGEKLDLNNSDLIACTLERNDKKERRFLVIDFQQIILVEPDTKRLGWGVVTFVGYLQDVEVVGDKDDSRCLHVTVHQASPGATWSTRSAPILSSKMIFDDHIRCMAAKQRLGKGRARARHAKMLHIAKLLDIPAQVAESMIAVGSEGGSHSYKSGYSGPSPSRSPVPAQHAAGPSTTGRSRRSPLSTRTSLSSPSVATGNRSPGGSSATLRSKVQAIQLEEMSVSSSAVIPAPAPVHERSQHGRGSSTGSRDSSPMNSRRRRQISSRSRQSSSDRRDSRTMVETELNSPPSPVPPTLSIAQEKGTDGKDPADDLGQGAFTL